MVPHTCNKDEEQNNGGITGIEQTGTDLNKVWEVYFDLTKIQKMAYTKYSVKKKVVWEGKKPPVIQKAVTKDVSTSGKRKRRFQQGTKVPERNKKIPEVERVAHSKNSNV